MALKQPHPYCYSLWDTLEWALLPRNEGDAMLFQEAVLPTYRFNPIAFLEVYLRTDFVTACRCSVTLV